MVNSCLTGRCAIIGLLQRLAGHLPADPVPSMAAAVTPFERTSSTFSAATLGRSTSRESGLKVRVGPTGDGGPCVIITSHSGGSEAGGAGGADRPRAVVVPIHFASSSQTGNGAGCNAGYGHLFRIRGRKLHQSVKCSDLGHAPPCPSVPPRGRVALPGGEQ